MRAAWRWGLRGLLALALLLLLTVVAWLVSNGPWADAAPQPLAPALQLTPAQVPLERNGFVDLQGLDVPASADIHEMGLAALQGFQDRGEDRLRWPQGEPWTCHPDREACAQLWLSQPDKLRGFLAMTEVLGRRCERVAEAQAVEEIVFERPSSGPLAQVPFAGLPIPRFAEVTSCVRWFGMKALAAAQPQDALAELVRADRLARMALQGSRSLIGTMVGLAAVQRSWLLAADLVANRSMEPALLMPLLAPLPAAQLSPRAWIPTEARFTREVIRDMVDTVHGCHQAQDLNGDPTAPWLDRQLCRFKLGVLPEQSAQDSDARWLARLATAPATGPVACETLQSALWRGQDAATLSWRNTLTRWMLDTPGVDWAPYAARQLDLELLRQTLVAQVLGQSPPGAVELTRESGAQRFAACRARLLPGQVDAILRLPLL